MYSNTKSVLKKGNFVSDPVYFNCRVKQGEGPSLLLFITETSPCEIHPRFAPNI